MIKLLIFIGTIICLNGCGLLQDPKTTFVLQNNSSYALNIKFFSKSRIVDSLKIELNKAFIKTVIGGDGSTTTPFSGDIDSIIIKFDNLKYIRQYCKGFKIYGNFDKCDFDKNLIDFYTGEYKNHPFKNKSTYTITFDNSDYEKATPL